MIKKYKEQFLKILGRKETLFSQLEDNKKKKENESKKYEAIERAQVFVQKIAIETQSQIRIHITPLIQTALDTVFPGKYKFHLEFVERYNHTEIDIQLINPDFPDKPVDPYYSNGGGLRDILAISLRISIFTLTHNRPVFLLDEPMKWLNSPDLNKDEEIPSSKLRLIFATIIKELSIKLGIQFIIITCDEELLEIKDKVFVVDQDKDGVSYVKELCD